MGWVKMEEGLRVWFEFGNGGYMLMVKMWKDILIGLLMIMEFYSGIV